MNIETIDTTLAELTPASASRIDFGWKITRGEPPTEMEAALERLAHLAYVTGCPSGYGIIDWLIENGFIEITDDDKLALTPKAFQPLLADINRRFVRPRSPV
jgi:hypothetical protein